ncbi:hypothetical protein [Tolypothrix sp. VBCCA 56010]|uniref:hypothetical protein n=1 Tax=Tolypothrix sp. VBCCA 56010 TaxID=3137731 RepID=UPI003D7D5604
MGSGEWVIKIITNNQCPMTAGATTRLTRATHCQTYAQCPMTAGATTRLTRATHCQTYAQCPMPNAPCPMPNAPFPMPNAQLLSWFHDNYTVSIW